MVVTRAKNNAGFVLVGEEIERASVMFNIGIDVLTILNSQALLNAEYIKDCIALEDYYKLTMGLRDLCDSSKVYTVTEVKRAICNKYHMTTTHFNKVLKGATKRPIFHCEKCGRIIPETQFERSGGICTDCLSNEIYSIDQ